MSLIETVDLGLRLDGRDVLKGINLKIDRGEVFAVIGPTGAGKTTLLRLIDLLETPTSGRIYFDGADVTEAGRLRFEIRRRMAFVLQKPAVFNMSVYDNIAYGLRWRGRKRTDVKKRVNDVLELVNMAPYKNRNARTLSGGEAQRVAIARAIAIEPEVLLLDEPMANLDPLSAQKIEELIQNIFHQYKTTIIMSTHDLPQGRRLAHRIGVMMNGEIVQAGKAEEIFDRPLSRQVAEFVGVENIISGTVASKDGQVSTIKLNGQAIEAVAEYAIGEEVFACIRPEDVTLALTKMISSARNTLVGEITKMALSRALVQVEINCGFPLVVLVTKKSVEELNLKMGGQVYASFKASAVHVLRKQRTE